MPPEHWSWNTIYRRFRRRSEAGDWEIVAATLAEIMAHTGHYSVDSTTVRAPVSAAGEKELASTRSWPLARRGHRYAPYSISLRVSG